MARLTPTIRDVAALAQVSVATVSRVLNDNGYADPDTSEVLKRPAPPVIDEEGIGAHDGGRRQGERTA